MKADLLATDPRGDDGKGDAASEKEQNFTEVV